MATTPPARTLADIGVDDADDVLAVTSFLEVLDPVAAARLAFYDSAAVESADTMWASLAAAPSVGLDPNRPSPSFSTLAPDCAASGGERTDSSSSESWRSAGGRKREGVAVGDAHNHKPRGKVRKSTYVVRKEERNGLLVEIAALEMRLKSLKELAGLSEDDSVEDTARANAQLRESLHRQQLSLATAQSVVSGLLNREHASPLGTPIHLGKDSAERRRTLAALKDEKIRHAYEYLDARARFTAPPHGPRAADERFENARGDFCCARYEVHEFAGARSVREVFDVLVAYLFNVQDAVSQRLGNRTERHNVDVVEGSVAHYHFLTTEHGVPIEIHGALFLHFFDSLAGAAAQGGPCGVVVVESVESDALYPYSPRERLRKDVTSIKMLTPHYRASADGRDAQELVVTLAQGKFLKLHHAECPAATPDAVEKIRASIAGWGDVMMSTMRESLRRRHR